MHGIRLDNHRTMDTVMLVVKTRQRIPGKQPGLVEELGRMQQKMMVDYTFVNRVEEMI